MADASDRASDFDRGDFQLAAAAAGLAEARRVALAQPWQTLGDITDELNTADIIDESLIAGAQRAFGAKAWHLTAI
jgi:hypothetical protein